MTANNLKVLTLTDTTISAETDEEFSIPLNISDIISICREYNSLGWQIQNQVENILEVGVEESIKNNVVKKTSLPQIKKFLQAICDNVYFGDATAQAQECLYIIDTYCTKLINNTLN